MPIAAIRRHEVSADERAALSRVLVGATDSGTAEHGEFVLKQGETSLTLPASAVRAILSVVSGLAEHGTIAVVEGEDELTPEQAADLLGMSRPMLMRSVKDGTIPHRLVGAHHRLRLADILAFQSLLGARREAMASMARHTDRMSRTDGA